MKDRKPIDIVDDAIIQFYLDSNVDDLVAMAKEEDYDLTKHADKRAKLAKQLRMKALAALNKERDSIIIAKAEKIVNDLVSTYVNKPISELRTLLQRQGLQVQFRNIEKLDEQTIRDMLKDVSFVELIEKLDKENR